VAVLDLMPSAFQPVHQEVPMYPESYWQWHLWVFPLILPIFWVGVIVLVLWLIFGRHRPWHTWELGPGPENDTALDILKKRYAKGDINRDEFERMKRDIMA
jgi:putative membrane protein